MINTDHPFQRFGDACVHLGESLAEVKQRWSCDWMSEVGGGKQQRRHLQVDQLEAHREEVFLFTA